MKIVLATDGSQNALHAANVLRALPFRERLEVTVVSTIVHPSLHPADTIVTWPREFWDELNASAQAAVDEMSALFKDSGATVTEKIIDGHAGQCLVKHASESSADLIVLGAQGHSAVERVMLGSVSDYVANHADCSVLAVRPSTMPAESPVAVTIAYDGSPRAATALDQYLQLDWPPSTKTNVLTVVPMVRFFGKDVLPESLGHRTAQHEIATQATEHASGRIETVGKKPSSHIVEAEHVGEAIVIHAKEQLSNLIMVGDSGLGGISRLMLGSVSKYVLRHADCSVWIARSR